MNTVQAKYLIKETCQPPGKNDCPAVNQQPPAAPVD
jgi:hypothetical protein